MTTAEVRERSQYIEELVYEVTRRGLSESTQ